MLKLASYDIVFAEIPGEVTLALNLSGCPNRCEGCHSPWLQEDSGEPLTDSLLDTLLHDYGDSVTCVAFMGGDADPDNVVRMARHIRETTNLKTAWYSGRNSMPDIEIAATLSEIPHDERALASMPFDYIKLGPYIASLGGLDSPATNQQLYHIVDGQLINITHLLHKHP